jgi:Na+-driven multidrug efflux pump
MALPAVIAPSWFVGVLTNDADIIAEASPILQLIAASMPFEAMGMVLLQVHFGAGAARRVITIAPPLQWLVFLPVITLLVYLGTTGFIVWLCFAGYRAVQTVIFAWSWSGKGWGGIRV